MSKLFYLLITNLLAIIYILPFSGFACTDFMIKSQDNAYIVGRSLEFGQILPVQIQVFSKGETVQSLAPQAQKGLSWTNKYSYIGLLVLPSKALMDGFNDQGLSVGALWMPGTEYPPLPPVPTDNKIFFADLGSWLLGNFASVEEATAALSKVSIYASYIPGFKEIPPIHLSIQDATGKSVALEFIKGKMYIFENPVGVLTNAPELLWHLTNLRNYINLSALNAGNVNIDGTVLEPTGQGSGLLGIPGDWTPPSRFIRTALFKQALVTPRDANAAVLAALHLLNTVDIPYGAIRATKDHDFDFTQWIVVKDLTNKKLYYRTYGNQNIYTLNLMDKNTPTTTDLMISRP